MEECISGYEVCTAHVGALVPLAESGDLSRGGGVADGQTGKVGQE